MERRGIPVNIAVPPTGDDDQCDCVLVYHHLFHMFQQSKKDKEVYIFIYINK